MCDKKVHMKTASASKANNAQKKPPRHARRGGRAIKISALAAFHKKLQKQNSAYPARFVLGAFYIFEA